MDCEHDYIQESLCDYLSLILDMLHVSIASENGESDIVVLSQYKHYPQYVFNYVMLSES